MASMKNFDPWNTLTFNLRWVWLAIAVIVAVSAVISSFVSVPTDSVECYSGSGNISKPFSLGCAINCHSGSTTWSSCLCSGS